MASGSDPKVLGTRLAGKVAIVTGGGSGFGESISKRFAEEGCKVIVADLDPVGGARVAAYHPHSMHFIRMDVAKEADWETCIENTMGKFGRVDILINNAGTSYRNKVSGVEWKGGDAELIEYCSRVWRSLKMSLIRFSM
jgi:NAD(P)-dependent dehydrogenase (short-subunit alcohol dehydrogenase family)